MSLLARRYYKRFLDITAAWPVDHSKGEGDLGTRIRDEVNAAFGDNRETPAEIRNVKQCENTLQSLEELVNDKHKKEFAVPLQHGVWRMTVEELQTLKSAENQKITSTTSDSPGLLTRLKNVFSSSSSSSSTPGSESRKDGSTGEKQ